MTTNELSKQLTQLADELETLVAGSEELMKATANDASEHVKGIRQRLSRTLESAKAAGRRWQDKTVQAARASDRVVRGHPYESIGVAIGVALLIGVLVGRRSTD